MISADQIQPGMAVVYRPGGVGKPEDGTVVRLSDDPSLVFVRYSWGTAATLLRDLEPVRPPVACDPDSFEWPGTDR